MIQVKIRLHDLRHTFASVALIEGGASIKEVSEMLHHASVQTTMRYLHLLEGQELHARKRTTKAIRERSEATPAPEALH